MGLTYDDVQLSNYAPSSREFAFCQTAACTRSRSFVFRSYTDNASTATSACAGEPCSMIEIQPVKRRLRPLQCTGTDQHGMEVCGVMDGVPSRTRCSTRDGDSRQRGAAKSDAICMIRHHP